MKKAIYYTLELAPPIFLVVVCVIQLRLYYAGAWYDPVQFIETTEVVVLYLTALLGVYCTIRKLLQLWNE